MNMDPTASTEADPAASGASGTLAVIDAPVPGRAEIAPDKAVAVTDLDEAEDYIEPDLDLYPNTFSPASIWTPGEVDMSLHPEETDDTRKAGLPRMSGEQLSAFLRAKEFLTGKARPNHGPDYSYWDDPYKLAGRVMILTGKAGSGKTSVVKWLMESLGDKSVILSATTGAAALQAGGVTVDRLFGIRRRPWNFMGNLTCGNMRKCPNGIIIDESSMIGERMAGLIAYLLKCYEEKSVVLVGDWAQARPVKDDWPFRSELFRAAELVRLTGCHRQTDPAYLEALNIVRGGGWTPWFGRCETKAPGEDVIRVYATNKLADGYNAVRYRQLVCSSDGVKKRFLASKIFAADERSTPANQEWLAIAHPDRTETGYMEACGLAHNLEVCVGARVLIVRNSPADQETGAMAYVNGDIGTIVEFTPSGISVKLDRTGKKVAVTETGHPVFDPAFSMRRPKYSIHGYPIRLGWAVTAHKTQGMTLGKMWGDMKSIMHHRRGADASGMHGLAYVMLSRCRDARDMTLDGSGAKWNYLDPTVANLI